jgi:hypothetical protein
VAGITTGVFLYVVAGIGEAVLYLWKAQQKSDEQTGLNTAEAQAMEE